MEGLDNLSKGKLQADKKISVKSDSQLQKNCLNCFDQSPFQMMKNAFF